MLRTVTLQFGVPSAAVWDLSDYGRLRLRRRLIAALSRSRTKCSAFGLSCASVAGPEVIKGTIVVDDPEFKDGTDVFILTRERESEVHLSSEELAELEAGIAEADRGEMIPGDDFLGRLRRSG